MGDDSVCDGRNSGALGFKVNDDSLGRVLAEGLGGGVELMMKDYTGTWI